jgi:hypothetical protein
VETGFIQTIESFNWKAKYGNGWERNLNEANIIDELPGASAPWYGAPGTKDKPNATGSVVSLTDEPQARLTVTHPDPAAKCAKLQEVTTDGKFHLWLIGAESSNASNNLVFLFHASVEFNKTFKLNSPTADPSDFSNWVAGGTQSETDKGFGKGSKTPVLTTPVPALLFKTQTGSPCPDNKK